MTENIDTAILVVTIKDESSLAFLPPPDLSSVTSERQATVFDVDNSSDRTSIELAQKFLDIATVKYVLIHVLSTSASLGGAANLLANLKRKGLLPEKLVIVGQHPVLENFTRTIPHRQVQTIEEAIALLKEAIV